MYHFFPRGLVTEEVETTPYKVLKYLVEFPATMITLGKHMAGTLSQNKIESH